MSSVAKNQRACYNKNTRPNALAFGAYVACVFISTQTAVLCRGKIFDFTAYLCYN